MRVILGLVPFIIIGCTSPLSTPKTPSNQCISLDNQHRYFGATAKFSGALAGAGGLATIPIGDDKKELRLSVAITALILGGLSAASVYIEQDAASAYAKTCTIQP